MPGQFRCTICQKPTTRPAISTIYSRANTCGEKCYQGWRDRRNKQSEARRTSRESVKPLRLHKPGRVCRPRPEAAPVVVAAVPVVDKVDAIFERARAIAKKLERTRPRVCDDE